MTTDPLSILSVRAEMPVTPAELRERMILRDRDAQTVTYGVCAAVAGAGMTMTAVGAICVLVSTQPLFMGYVAATAGLSTLFFIRGALQSRRTIKAIMAMDIGEIKVLQSSLEIAKGRIWGFYGHGSEVFGSQEGASPEDTYTSASGESGLRSSSGDVIPMNTRKPKGRFQ